MGGQILKERVCRTKEISSLNNGEPPQLDILERQFFLQQEGEIRRDRGCLEQSKRELQRA